jgi:hypothetical protein
LPTSNNLASAITLLRTILSTILAKKENTRMSKTDMVTDKDVEGHGMKPGNLTGFGASTLLLQGFCEFFRDGVAGIGEVPKAGKTGPDLRRLSYGLMNRLEEHRRRRVSLPGSVNSTMQVATFSGDDR